MRGLKVEQGRELVEVDVLSPVEFQVVTPEGHTRVLVLHLDNFFEVQDLQLFYISITSPWLCSFMRAAADEWIQPENF